MSVPLVEQNVCFLRQGADLLRRLTDDVYGPSEPEGVRSSGVGPQFRHCLDFYSCLLRDLDSGRVDYDRRRRADRLETDRLAALSEVEEIIDGLSRIAGEHIGSRLEVRCDLAPGEEPATAWSRSTLGRELRFLASHTVHHYALIALLLRQQGVEPGEGFGVAPATAAHWRDREPCAR